MAFVKEMAVVKRISDESRQTFFGYYDLKAYDKTDTKHLYCSPKFIDRIPKADDILELGYIDLHTGENISFAHTTLWNFQQACMLQWYGDEDSTVCYNVRNADGGSTCVHNLITGEKRYMQLPCAAVSPDGKYGLAINFGRIYDFRPGYGYAGLQDPRPNINAPDNDGVFLVNMNTGMAKLIISYKDCLKLYSTRGMDTKKLVINHITFSPSSDRFLFLLRNSGDIEDAMFTTLITSDLSGNMTVLLENKYASHYFWKNNKQILIHCNPNGKKGLYLVDDISGVYTELKSEYFEDDIHCIYSPDGKYIIGDGYAIHDEYRPLFIYNPETERTEYLLKAETIVPDTLDIRCDLHARWNRSGNKISFDTTDRGFREICELDVSGVNI